GHRRFGAGAALRLPDRERARSVRRHARARWRRAGMGTFGAVAAGRGRAAGEGDEPHRAFPHRRGGAGMWAGEPRRAPPPAPAHSARAASWSAPTISADRKSTRLNCSHGSISYAVFCLKKKKIKSTRKTGHAMRTIEALEVMYVADVVDFISATNLSTSDDGRCMSHGCVTRQQRKDDAT